MDAAFEPVRLFTFFSNTPQQAATKPNRGKTSSLTQAQFQA